MNLLAELDDNKHIENINKKYDIRLCLESDIVDMKNFLQQHWKEDHILTKHDELLDWQFYNKKKKCYNIIIAIDNQTKEIHGILFFIPSDHYEYKDFDGGVWLCMFKVLSSIKKQGLGTALCRYLNKIISITNISVIGISDEFTTILKERWGFCTGVCSHFYMMNDKIEKPIVAINPIKSKLKCETNIIDFVDITLDEYKEIEDSFFMQNNLCRSKIFYINRYYKAPIYRYKFIAIKNKNNLEGILIIRVCQALNVNVIRIVDFIGDINVLLNTYDNFQKLLFEENAEYIDFVCAGFDEEILMRSGFTLKDSTKTIVPNFFEPFEHKNVDIKYANKTSFKDIEIVFVKGDSDQDRPNML